MTKFFIQVETPESFSGDKFDVKSALASAQFGCSAMAGWEFLPSMDPEQAARIARSEQADEVTALRRENANVTDRCFNFEQALGRERAKAAEFKAAVQKFADAVYEEYGDDADWVFDAGLDGIISGFNLTDPRREPFEYTIEVTQTFTVCGVRRRGSDDDLVDYLQDQFVEGGKVRVGETQDDWEIKSVVEEYNDEKIVVLENGIN